MRLRRWLRCALPFALLAATAAHAGTLTIESWRVDDKRLWEEVLIPAFQRSHPGIEVKFVPTAPTEYDGALAGRLAAGTAGDLVACRPFDMSLSLYRKGYLDRLDGKPGMQNFSPTAMVAWQTDNGRDTFCMPLASVIHGFFYNKKIFRRLDLQAPRTVADFFTVLEVLKKAGVAPLAFGTADKWESSQIVFTNIGPNFWRGEEGRKALIAGKARLTDAPFVDALRFEARMGRYLEANAATQTYRDSQARFASGQAAIYPSGSWDIAPFSRVPNLELGVFAPPVRAPGGACYISDHMDLGIGVNRQSKNKDDAYRFLAWVGSQEFADLYTNRLTGFFTLSNHLIAVRDPIAKQMAEWRNSCASTIRFNAQVLNRGRPSMESALWDINARVLNGEITPEQAAATLQQGFASWYRPQRKQGWRDD
ncbi:ABC transporter substrate-binding protein [Herbaspirillum sp. SJZ107]|uniref:ABC transporter substrate-binding protein n=1 Tax=Herbaspirillum sp. SJZ107 TaxID=2572881 RepID=UPI00114FA21A|nr:ABC transporter substrate-binding protein [Herbaspirillum sp. SJZ107]TQK08310.1 carbohydrate ABC transporter substrate-binding protein (CUT1 family) [Herbaspirillum sp. SJZ107]